MKSRKSFLGLRYQSKGLIRNLTIRTSKEDLKCRFTLQALLITIVNQHVFSSKQDISLSLSDTVDHNREREGERPGSRL